MAEIGSDAGTVEKKREKFGQFLYVGENPAPPSPATQRCDQVGPIVYPCDSNDIHRRQKSYNKGELALKHAIGLGAVENIVPISQPSTNAPPRSVEIGWHPVGGLTGKWFAEKTGLGKMITEKINKYPDPTQHWAVLVGEYAHQLWMDENFDIIYTNAKVEPNEWHTFPVGETKFNDDALRRTGKCCCFS